MNRPARRAPRTLASIDVALDIVGFALGLGLSLVLGWRTTDLVWGLWLSSLVIGVASLLVGIARASQPGAPPAAMIALKVFLVGFFAVHFGMFHFVHSVFLNQFFPLAAASGSFWPGLAGYREVLASYWPWLLAAAIAERHHLLLGACPAPRSTQAAAGATDGDHTTNARAATGLGFDPMRPYRNVIRMHLLIFFFAGMYAVGLDNFMVHAVVYATYFWPWRGRAMAVSNPGRAVA